MSRWPRLVVPDIAVHVIQRGNHRQPIFFATGDYDRFLEELGLALKAYSCEIHAYALNDESCAPVVHAENRERRIAHDAGARSTLCALFQ